jgi:dTDP-4-dehydrorhamnose reductase
MKVLITGADGVLGMEVRVELARLGHRVFATDITQNDPTTVRLDITDSDAVLRYCSEAGPDIILHLAAATDLDYCEQHPDYAHKMNVTGTENVARAARDRDDPLVYVSTGGVFDGKKPGPYIESDIPNPVNTYARTKLEGEAIVQNLLKRCFIFRLAWLTGGGRKDGKFVGKILGLLEHGARTISAVSDISGSPTFATDFAQSLMPTVEAAPFGLYHMVNKGGCSRLELAGKIVEFMGLSREVTVRAVNASLFPTVAPRPCSEILHNHKLENLNLNRMPTWQDGLRRYVSKLTK